MSRKGTTPADLRNLQRIAGGGAQGRAFVEQMLAGPGSHLLGQKQDIAKDDRELFSCPCGNQWFEELTPKNVFTNKRDRSEIGAGQAQIFRCFRCKVWMRLTKQEKDGKKISAPQFIDVELGINQINLVLEAEKRRWLDEMAGVIDDFFGQDKEKECEALMVKLMEKLTPAPAEQPAEAKPEPPPKEEEKPGKIVLP